jgi:outer membrane receptor protein involved in Fe transport
MSPKNILFGLPLWCGLLATSLFAAAPQSESGADGPALSSAEAGPLEAAPLAPAAAPAGPVLRPEGGKGNLAGVVSDRATGTPVRGVAVVLAGTDVGALTDLAGRFQLNDVPAGSYTVTFIKGGFLDANVTGVQVEPGATRRLDFALAPRPTEMSDEVFDLSDVTVTAEEAGVLVQGLELRLGADQLLNIFSAEDFSKFAAGDVADALKRVSGVNIVEGQFAIIRGLEDRYSSTTYNSAPVPSPDPNSQSVQLDLFPSDIVGNLVVAKTFSGDLPGNSSGGSINIVTHEYPEAWTLKIDGGTGYGDTANARFLGLVPGSPVGVSQADVVKSGLGVTFGGRTRVAGRELRLNLLVAHDQDFATKLGTTESLEPRLAQGRTRRGVTTVTRSGDLALGQLSLSAGRFDVTESTRAAQDTAYLGLGFDFDRQGRHRLDASFFRTEKAEDTVRSDENGVLPNFDYRALADKQNNGDDIVSGDYLGFATNSAWIARPRATAGEPPSRGPIWYAPTYEGTSLRRVRDLEVQQLNGDHTFALAGALRLTWAANRASTTQREEAYGARYFYEPDDTTQVPTAPATVAALGPGRFASTNDVYFSTNAIGESQDFVRADVEHERKFAPWLGLKLTAGVHREHAARDVRSSYLQSPTVGGLGQFSVLADTPEELGVAIFNTLDRVPATGEISGTRNSTNRSARDIRAAHLGAKTTLWEQLDVLASFRLEEVRLQSLNNPFYTQPGGTMNMYPNRFVLASIVGLPPGSIGDPFTEGAPFAPADLPFYQGLVNGSVSERLFLPALGATWRPTAGTSLRFAWSETAARPSFREQGYYVSVDPGSSELVVGNPQLTLSEVESWDVRFEHTWGEGDLVALSVFRKKIARPIESLVVRDPTNFEGSGGLFRTFINNPAQADLAGLEVEARKGLGFLGGFARYFTVGGNFTHIDAEVRRTPAELANTAGFFGVAPGDTALHTGLAPKRRLFGQPAWIANADLTFDHPGWGTRATLAWSAISDVLDAAGSATIGPNGAVNAASLDRYLGSHRQLDLILSQKLGRWTFKLSVKNLTDTTRTVLYDPGQTAGPIARSSYRLGRRLSFSATFAF